MKLQSRMKARFKSATHSEQGFTLVELVVTMSIVSIIVASLAGSFIVGLKSMGSTQQRFDQSHDAQLLSMYFIPDAQSVDPGGVVTAPTAPLGCGGPGQTPPVYVPGTDVSALRLEWTDSSGIPGSARSWCLPPAWLPAVRVRLSEVFTNDTRFFPYLRISGAARGQTTLSNCGAAR